MLNERGYYDGPRQTGVMHGDPDGIVVYKLQENDEPGPWRTLWTGSDQCGTRDTDRRTHDHQRMLVANRWPWQRTPGIYDVWIDACDQACSLTNTDSAGATPYPAPYWTVVERGLGMIGVGYRINRSAPLDHSMTGPEVIFRGLTPQQRSTARKYVVTVTGHNDPSSLFSGWETKGRGTPAEPDEAAISRLAIQNAYATGNPDATAMGYGQAHTILHEIGHCGRAGGWFNSHCPETRYCVMNARKQQESYYYMDYIWGHERERWLFHMNKMRRRVGVYADLK